MCPVNGNCRNTPVEVFESKYPFLTLGYEMRKDSGGAGKYRGGPGSARRLRVLAPEITVSALLDRTRTQAWRLFGGLPGASGGLLVGRKGDAEFRTFSEAFGTMSNSKLTRIVLQGYVPLAAALGASPAGPPEFVQDAPAERKTRLPRDVGHWEKLCCGGTRWRWFIAACADSSCQNGCGRSIPMERTDLFHVPETPFSSGGDAGSLCDPACQTKLLFIFWLT